MRNTYTSWSIAFRTHFDSQVLREEHLCPLQSFLNVPAVSPEEATSWSPPRIFSSHTPTFSSAKQAWRSGGIHIADLCVGSKMGNIDVWEYFWTSVRIGKIWELIANRLCKIGSANQQTEYEHGNLAERSCSPNTSLVWGFFFWRNPLHWTATSS